MVPGKAKGACPKFGTKVDLTVRVQDGMTGSTTNGIIGQRCGRSTGWIKLLEGCIESPKRSNAASGFEARAWPGMEGETSSKHLLGRCHIPGAFLHDDYLLISILLRATTGLNDC
jgi:hypothetical protein